MLPMRIPLLWARSVESLRLFPPTLNRKVSRTSPVLAATTCRRLLTMASPTRILVRADETGLLGIKQTPEAAAKVSALLQEDMEKHNVFFNEKGYHNHLVHQLLTLYGTGATPEDIQRGYDNNKSYQLKRNEQGEEVQSALHDNFDEAAKEFFGRGRYYGNFLRFYQEEIEKLGWQETVLKYLINNEQNFTRLFSGLLHPYLQLMYGLEWAQPALVAEGLAQTSIHRDNFGALFAAVDEKARRNPPAPRQPPRHLAELLETIGDEHPQLVAEPKFEDGDGSRTAVMDRIPDQVAEYLAANVRVDPDNNLNEQIDAMVHASAYIAAASIFHPPHKPKFDFFIIHHNNLTPAFLWLKTQDWIPAAAKARLLEWKLRAGVLTFVSRGSPRLDVDALRRYVPNDVRTGRARAMVGSPEELLPRLHAVADDGHAIKVARAFLLAQRASKPYLGRAQRPAWIRLADDETWLKAHYALLDSVEGANMDAGKEPRWVRSAGFDGAWQDVPKM